MLTFNVQRDASVCTQNEKERQKGVGEGGGRREEGREKREKEKSTQKKAEKVPLRPCDPFLPETFRLQLPFQLIQP